MQTRIGEVIESTSTSFTAGAYELLEAPPFGALVRAQARAEDMAVYGLVYDIRTGSKEQGGRALVRGRTYSGRDLYDAEIYHEHPDLAEVLQTEFTAITVGFIAHGQIYQYLAPQPPISSLPNRAKTTVRLGRGPDIRAFANSNTAVTPDASSSAPL